jgi:hypothetical protein
MSDGAPSLDSSRYESGEPSSESLFVLEFTLPDNAHSEAEGAHRLLLASVARLVRGDLLSPPLRVCLRQASEGAGLVSVPEASMNEDTPSLLLVCDVRPPRESGGTDSIPSAEPMQEGTNRLFGGSVALTHGLHADRRLGRDGVGDAS